MIRSLKVLLIAVTFFTLFVGVTTATTSAATANSCTNKTTFFGLPAWYEYLQVDFTPDGGVDSNGVPTGDCEINTDSSSGNVFILISLAIIDILFRLGAIVAVIFVVYGGFMFITSQGEPAKIVSARKAILNAVIGLVIVILASQIVKFIAKFLSS